MVHFALLHFYGIIREVECSSFMYIYSIIFQYNSHDAGLSLLKCYYDCFKIKIVRLRNTQLKEETNINKNIPKEQNEKAELNNIDKAHDHKDKNGLTKEINKSDAINETQNNVIKVDDLIIEKLKYKCIVDNKVQSSVNASNFEEESEGKWEFFHLLSHKYC